MPIIVDEIIISVEVTNTESGGSSAPASSDTSDKQAIVAECVEKVLDVLKQREDR